MYTLTYFESAERVGPHYFKDPIIVSDSFIIHWTPEGCKYYKEHYEILLQHTQNATHHDYIRLILKRIEKANNYYQSFLTK